MADTKQQDDLPDWLKPMEAGSNEDNLLEGVDLTPIETEEDELTMLRRQFQLTTVFSRIVTEDWKGASEILAKLGVDITDKELETLGPNNKELMDIYVEKGPDGYLQELKKRFPKAGSVAA